MNDARHESLRVLFAGGGTGGHVMPGVATAEALAELVPESRVLFLTSPRDSERRCWQAVDGFETASVPATPWEGLASKLAFPVRSLAAADRCLSIMRIYRPQVVVGLGSYNCVVPVLAARALGLRTLLLASDVIPGKAVRALAPLVDGVAVQWPEAREHLRTDNVIVAGNPVRRRIFNSTRYAALRRLGLSPRKVTLLAMGGSQGARAVNDALFVSLPLLADRAEWLQVLHLVGPGNIAEARQRAHDCPVEYHPVEFMDGMEDAYAAADFVLGRAGGSTLAELTAVGLPSVLVPYPHHKDQHQARNAAVLSDAAAAITIPQDELTAARLAQTIRELTDNARLRAWMGRRARDVGRPQAAQTVAGEIARLGGFECRADSTMEPIIEIITQQTSQAA